MRKIAGYTVVDADCGERFSTIDYPILDGTTAEEAYAAAESRLNNLSIRYGKEFALEVWGNALTRPANQ